MNKHSLLYCIVLYFGLICCLDLTRPEASITMEFWGMVEMSQGVSRSLAAWQCDQEHLALQTWAQTWTLPWVICVAFGQIISSLETSISSWWEREWLSGSSWSNILSLSKLASASPSITSGPAQSIWLGKISALTLKSDLVGFSFRHLTHTTSALSMMNVASKPFAAP